MGSKCSLNAQESEFVFFNILKKESKLNKEKLRCEHIFSIELNDELKNIQIIHYSFFILHHFKLKINKKRNGLIY